MTRNQAKYQATRARDKEYNRKMRDPHGPGRASMREDGAQHSAILAYCHKLEEHGFTTSDD